MTNNGVACDQCGCYYFDCVNCDSDATDCKCDTIDLVCHECRHPAWTDTSDVWWEDDTDPMCYHDYAANVLVCSECRVFRLRLTGSWNWFDSDPRCICENALTSLECDTCEVKRDAVDEEWEWNGDTDRYEYSYEYKCRHFDHRVEFPNGISVFASSLKKRTPSDTAPDFGLYLDGSWRPASLAFLVDWPDFSAPDKLIAAARAIIETYAKAAAGWWIEIGCIGGHGRTGATLGCMATLAGVPVDDVVEWVRSNYCGDAIEGIEQEWFIEWFHAYVNGLEHPDRPVYDLDAKDYVYKDDYVTGPVDRFTWEGTDPFPTGEPSGLLREPQSPRGAVVYRYVDITRKEEETVDAASQHAADLRERLEADNECIVCGPIEDCLCMNKQDRKQQLSLSG